MVSHSTFLERSEAYHLNLILSRIKKISETVALTIPGFSQVYLPKSGKLITRATGEKTVVVHDMTPKQAYFRTVLSFQVWESCGKPTRFKVPITKQNMNRTINYICDISADKEENYLINEDEAKGFLAETLLLTFATDQRIYYLLKTRLALRGSALFIADYCDGVFDKLETII